MSYLKKRIALFLCMVMAFTTVFCVIPQTETKAASKMYWYWRFDSSEAKVKETQIEVGAKDLYLGDYIEVYGNKDYGYLSNNSGVSYKSSNKAVVDIDKNGKITAKKAGASATITVKFKGITQKCKLNVVKSLASEKQSYISGCQNYEAVKSATEKFVSAYGSGITAKNRYNVLSAYKEYYKNQYGAMYFEYKNNKVAKSSIVFPIFGRGLACAQAAYKYGRQNNPMGTFAAKYFKIKSIKGQGTKITITLKSKVTENQIVGIQYGGIGWEEITAGKTSTLKVPMYIAKKDWTNSTPVIATVKKGSNQITIKTKKLKKGTTYRLYGGTNGGWLEYGSKNPNTFKAK